MKIQEYSASIEEQLSEFDFWVTPSLGEIRDTNQFLDSLENLKSGLNILADITDKFNEVESCLPSVLATRIIKYLSERDHHEESDTLNKIFSVILICTGKTDNNIKCQFPLYLRSTLGLTKYSRKSPKGGNNVEREIPRVLEINNVIKIFTTCEDCNGFKHRFLEAYLKIIISDFEYARQIQSVGQAFILQKNNGNPDSLLTPFIIFSIRGSITAVQGHMPEKLLRACMEDWGMIPGHDFNTQDITVEEVLGESISDKKKRRAYDFVLPFKPSTDSKLFIQCQYYAGDSGSVSHKVLDQTDSARDTTIKKYNGAIFLECLDGAGYYASLNGDLRKMLEKETTHDFFQIRTAPIKLRRALQEIHYLTPLEVEHAIMQSCGKEEEIINILCDEGYEKSDVLAALRHLSESKAIIQTNSLFNLSDSRIIIARRYCLLDIVANYGNKLSISSSPGKLLVGGFSPLWGLAQNETVKKALDIFPMLKFYWSNDIQSAFDDIQWLIDKGYIILK